MTPSKSTVEVLREARQLIEDPERWTRNDWAVNDVGDRLKPRDPNACAWCLGGAVARVVDDNGFEEAEVPFTDIGVGAWAALEDAAGEDPINFNDGSANTHADILRAFDSAIAAEEAKAQGDTQEVEG